MKGRPVTSGVPQRDRPLVLCDVLEEIARLKAAGTDAGEVDRLVAEFRRLRAGL